MFLRVPNKHCRIVEKIKRPAGSDQDGSYKHEIKTLPHDASKKGQDFNRMEVATIITILLYLLICLFITLFITLFISQIYLVDHLTKGD